MRRKPIRMTTMVGGNGDELLMVLCEDGTIWEYDYQHTPEEAPWTQLPEIPHDTPEQDFEPPRQPE